MSETECYIDIELTTNTSIGAPLIAVGGAFANISKPYQSELEMYLLHTAIHSHIHLQEYRPLSILGFDLYIPKPIEIYYRHNRKLSLIQKLDK